MFRTAIALAPKKKLTRAAAVASSKSKKKVAAAAKVTGFSAEAAKCMLGVIVPETAQSLSVLCFKTRSPKPLIAAAEEVAAPVAVAEVEEVVAAKFDVVDLAAEESAAATESITENDDACFTADTHQHPTEAAVDAANNEAAEVEAPALSEEEALAATEHLEALGTYSALDVAPAEVELEAAAPTIDAEPTVVAASAAAEETIEAASAAPAEVSEAPIEEDSANADVASMEAAFDVAPAEAHVEAAPAVIEAVEAEPTIAAVSAPAAEETIEAASAAPAEISEAPEVTEAAAPVEEGFEFRPVW